MIRAYGVARGDSSIIRWIGIDHASTHTSMALTFAAVLLATSARGMNEPLRWIGTALVAASIGLAAFATIGWLLGISHGGTAAYIQLMRTAGFAITPIALGSLGTSGVAVGFAVALLAGAGIVRELHRIEWLLSAGITFVQLLVVFATVSAV